MNNPFDYTPDSACNEAFRLLVDDLERLKVSTNVADWNFIAELEAGKMLGVLIATDSSGKHHTLYAFSGQLGNGGFFRAGFVGPVFDYLHPSGYFKLKEAEISKMNIEIERFEKGELRLAQKEYEDVKIRHEAEITAYKEKCRESKSARSARRESGNVSADEEAAMIRQSQFEKAELHRLKKKVGHELTPFANHLEESLKHLETLKSKRRDESENLQRWLFSNFMLLNARGDMKSLSEIFAETALQAPPSGAGECCAPKLLQAAYLKGWQPLGMAEYWYGNPKQGEVRIHGEYYPACRGKCLPVLSWMLQGLDVYPPMSSDARSPTHCTPEILFENQWFCVVNKPAGMLSVPGKGSAVSVQQWLTERFGVDKNVKVAHRLDQDTSGVLVATFGDESFKVMQRLFAKRLVKKRYVADLVGDYNAKGIAKQGHIILPLSADFFDRPRQVVDNQNGKEAITDYEFSEVTEGKSRVFFSPLTGRTHQLRVHAASADGLGMEIVGDPLYGAKSAHGNERMHLHAQKIEFTFPLDGEYYCFETPVPF